MTTATLSAFQKHAMNVPLSNYIESYIVKDNLRLSFMPKMSGVMFFEQTLYGIAQRLCPDYNGGFWKFVEIPREGEELPARFIFPDFDAPVEFANVENCSTGILSPIEFGIGVTLIALSHASFKDRTDKSANAYYALREWMRETPEGIFHPHLFMMID